MNQCINDDVYRAHSDINDSDDDLDTTSIKEVHNIKYCVFYHTYMILGNRNATISTSSPMRPMNSSEPVEENTQ